MEINAHKASVQTGMTLAHGLFGNPISFHFFIISFLSGLNPDCMQEVERKEEKVTIRENDRR